jgi:hypothetical protein
MDHLASLTSHNLCGFRLRSDACSWDAGVFAETFVRLHRRGIAPAVLHPAVQPPAEAALRTSALSWRSQLDPDLTAFLSDARAVFLSINRFERKKVRNGWRSRIWRGSSVNLAELIPQHCFEVLWVRNALWFCAA